MKKIVFLTIFVILILSVSVAHAASPSVYIYPAGGNGSIGTPFTLNVNVKPDGTNVCVVKGSLRFGNLSCQSISVAPGLMAVVSPTCSNTNFSIGIPKCISSNKTLFLVTVKGQASGSATLNFPSVKVIGSGALLSSDSVGGSYDIAEAPLQTKTENPVVEQNIKTETPELTTEASSQTAALSNQQQKVLFDVSAKSGLGKSNTQSMIIWMLVIIVVAVVAIYYTSRASKKRRINNLKK